MEQHGSTPAKNVKKSGICSFWRRSNLSGYMKSLAQHNRLQRAIPQTRGFKVVLASLPWRLFFDCRLIELVFPKVGGEPVFQKWLVCNRADLLCVAGDAG